MKARNNWEEIARARAALRSGERKKIAAVRRAIREYKSRWGRILTGTTMEKIARAVGEPLR
jgi:hypothetical protein